MSNLLNGSNIMTTSKAPKEFKDLWMNHLPARFPKTKCIEMFAERLGINERSTYLKLITKNGLLAQDLLFLYNHFGIAFDYKEGFFLDEKKFDEAMLVRDREAAAAVGLIL